jgi:hypothetical protein
LWLHVAALAIYLGLALLLWANVWFGGNPAHAITCNCGDTAQQIWWFEWLPWAVIHGHDPLFSNALWARLGGVNALANTSWLAPGALLSPVTILFGPVASFNVANLLAPALSGGAAFALAGRITSRTGARLIAGGVYAFSPFVLRNTVLGHLGLTLTAYLPLMLLLGMQLLSRDGRPVRIGIWIGLLTILQFFTSLEVLALTAVIGTMCALGAVICRPNLVAGARHRLVSAVSLSVLFSGAVLVYPIWFYLAGPRHVVGPYWPVSSSSPWQIIDAGPNVFNSHTGLTAVGYLGPQGPNSDFLGWGLLLAVAISSPLWCRRRLCVVVAGVGLVSWVLEFTPADLWERLPLLSSIELVRFALPVSLCMGLLLAASIDGWWSVTARWWTASPHLGRRRLARGGIVIAALAAFIPTVVTYSLSLRVETATVPAWFTQNARHLPSGTAVLTLPFAFGIMSRPMAWQAESDDAFNLIGGWAFVPGGNGFDDEMVSPLGGPVAALRALSRDPLATTTAEQATIRVALLRWRPLVIVVEPQYAAPGTRVVLIDILRRSPTWSDGAWVWNLRRKP